MRSLIRAAKHALKESKQLPFSVYSCVQEQNIFNVPIVKPILIVVLSGEKELSKTKPVICSAGTFVFLSNSRTFNMRNIPNNNEYFALIIEFDYQDFNFFKEKPITTKNYFTGEVSPVLKNTLKHFIEWSLLAPEELWAHRRQEILSVLYYLGYKDVYSMMESKLISNELHQIVSNNISAELNNSFFCEQLAMSESTIRRKLKLEGTSIQQIKTQVKLGHALHLIQSTTGSVGYIAEQCGYQSQSRFTEKFKGLFGVTPSQLRKTRMQD